MGFYAQAVKWVVSSQQHECFVNMTLTFFFVFSLHLPPRTYSKAQRVLDMYQHMPSFHSIQVDCSAIVDKLKAVLMEKMNDQKVTKKGDCTRENTPLSLHSSIPPSLPPPSLSSFSPVFAHCGC